MNRANRVRTPLLAAVFYIAVIMPREFSVSLGGLRLSPYRVVLLIVTIPLLLRLFQNHRQPPHAVDFLVMAHAAWAVLALAVYGGIGTGLESGGIYAVESLGAYLLGRMTVTSAAEHRALLRFMVVVLGVMFLLTLPESLTGTHFIREAARAVAGGPGLPYIEPRLGLDRAFGSFDHPILYGVFAASTFAATYYVLNSEQLRPRAIVLLGMVACSTFLSLSAGPFVGLACQAVVIGWDRITKGISLRWTPGTEPDLSHYRLYRGRLPGGMLTLYRDHLDSCRTEDRRVGVSAAAVAGAAILLLGLGIVSRYTVELELETGRLVELDVRHFPLRRYWYLVRRRDKQLSPVAQRFESRVLDRG